jgi:hypothetical protein
MTVSGAADLAAKLGIERKHALEHLHEEPSSDFVCKSETPCGLYGPSPERKAIAWWGVKRLQPYIRPV